MYILIGCEYSRIVSAALEARDPPMEQFELIYMSKARHNQLYNINLN